MKRLKIPPQITIETSKRVFAELSARLDGENPLELDLDGAVLSSITKALLRRLSEKYGDKLVISDEIKRELFYQKELSDDQKNEKPETSLIVKIDDRILKIWNSILSFLAILVDMIFYAFKSLYDRKFILKDDTTKNAYYIGWSAIPIVFLLSLMIGFTVALQAAIQLDKMGGVAMLAMMLTVVMVKELGPLITAIIIAGRTGSSIAAEIGTMSVMEEIDALKTMGVEQLKFLLVPKFWAFTAVMPILTIVADVAGIAGGFWVASTYDVPTKAFLISVMDSVELKDIFWGIAKSVSFAWVILAVGSFKGLNVRGGADAVGRATTESVVISIFMVVAVDALFSFIIYT